MSVKPADVKRVALSFPEALEKLSYGHPSFFIGKTFFTRVRKEDDSIVLGVAGMEQRDMMLELDPETYFITDHYRNWPMILVRMSKITKTELRTMLERRFEAVTAKKPKKKKA